MQADAHPDLLAAADRLVRPRLLARVQRLLQPPARALWIAAGAGMGKSTLAQQVLAQHDARGFMLRLDETCADGASVARRLAEGVDVAARPALSLSREQIAVPAAGLRPVWRQLWAALPRRSWIVLDDLQRGGSDDALATWLPAALEELQDIAEGPRMLLLSRRAPPAALARAQLDGRLARLPAHELAFDDAELQAWRPGASRRLGSWPAALSRHATDGEPGDRLLRDLLEAEVLPELSPRERQLLQRLAWLPGAVDARAALALGDDAAAAERLDQLAERGLLVDRLAPGRWQLHALLAEALRRTDDDGWRTTLAWLEGAGASAPPAAAVGPDGADERPLALALAALEAGVDGPGPLAKGAHATDPTQAESAAAAVDRLLVAHAPRWLAACRHRALAALCARVPPAQRSAALWGALAAALAAFDPRAGREAAIEVLRAEPAAPAALRIAALSQVIAAHFQTFDRTEPLAHWLAQLAPLEAECATLAPEAASALAIGAFSALFLRQPSHPALPRWHAAVQPLPAAPIDPNLRLRATMLLAKQAWYTADHAGAALLPDAARSALDDARCTPYARLLWGLTQQYRAWARADLAGGRSATAVALAEAEASGVHGLDRHLRLHDACFARLLGDADAARAQLAAALAGVDATRRMEAWHVHSVQAWLALEDGDLALASAAVHAAIDAGAAMGPAPQAMSWWIAGQVALACEASPPAAATAAGAAISALDRAAERDGNPRAALAARWLEAQTALQAGDADAVLPSLAAALAAMRRSGHGLWFGLHRAAAARLAARALAAGIETGAACALVRQHRLRPPPAADARWPWDVRLVLHRLGDGLTIEVDGAPVALGPKAPHRPLQLLRALAEAGGRANATQLADRLWPEAEGDRARDAFEVALRRARALLGHADALQLAGGVLGLDPARVWIESARAHAPAHLPPTKETAG